MKKIFLILCLITATAWSQVPDLTACESDIPGYGIFDLSVQSPILISQQPIGNYLVTYHASLANATASINAIANISAYYGTNGQVIYARTENTTTHVYTIATFALIVNGPQPHLNDGFVCTDMFGNPMNTYMLNCGLSSSQYSFSWAYNGNLIPSATQSSYNATAPGTYTVTATGTGNCSGSATCVISADQVVSYADVNINGTTVTFLAFPFGGNYEYSIDNGVNYQESNVFVDVIPEIYTCIIRNLSGCGQLSVTFDTTLGAATNQFKDFSYGPNPVNENLTLSNGYNMDHINVYNTLGQQLFVKNLQSKDFVLDCSNFNNGVYFLKVQSENQEQTFRFIKK